MVQAKFRSAGITAWIAVATFRASDDMSSHRGARRGQNTACVALRSSTDVIICTCALHHRPSDSSSACSFALESVATQERLNKHTRIDCRHWRMLCFASALSGSELDSAPPAVAPTTRCESQRPPKRKTTCAPFSDASRNPRQRAQTLHLLLGVRRPFPLSNPCSSSSKLMELRACSSRVLSEAARRCRLA